MVKIVILPITIVLVVGLVRIVDHDVDLGYIVVSNEMKEAAFQLYRKQWNENGVPVHTPTEFLEEHQLNNKEELLDAEMVFERLQKKYGKE